jgi:hypothetical protein
MPEARFHPRLRVLASADVIGSEVVLSRPVDDLSLGGCKFSGPAWEEPGATVSVVLNFPSIAATVPVAGVVVRSGPREMAVRFQGLADEQKSALRKHIQDSQDAAAAD